ncbi:MAG: DHHA1 domain-containing protein [bacterium]|nr:DHHA1 domain-containing protein [bacterium]
MRKQVLKDIVVLYHADCSDGFGGAWAAWKKFGARASYLPVRHDLPVPKGLRGKEIYMIDFTYRRPRTVKLMVHNKRVTAIDHHESVEDVTKLTKDNLYSTKHSGAVLAWNYFHPRKKVPILLRYIEDRDMWWWKMPKAHELLACMEIGERNFSSWNKIAIDLENIAKRRRYIERGKAFLLYDQHIVKDLAKHAELVRFEGHTIYAINAPHRFANEVGALLYKKLPSFALVWREQEGKILVSMRGDGKVDTGKIAKKFGGGGHPASSGFVFNAGARPWKLIRNGKK